MKSFRLYFGVFISVILAMAAGLVLVCLIPNDAIEVWYKKSMDQISAEEPYPSYFFNADAAIMDNFTDKLMIQNSRVSDNYRNAFEAAMDNNGYARYWNGYILTLRPLLTFLSYQQIRYLNMYLFLLLFCLVFSGLHRQIGFPQALAFVLSVAGTFAVLIPESLQYVSVYFIMLGMMCVLLYARGKARVGILFMVCGMVTNYFDILTAPLLTLGMPLILWVLLERKTGIRELFRLSLLWGLGYAGCWIMKWCLGSLILHRNVFADALQTAQFRVAGNSEYPLNRMEALRVNAVTYWLAKGNRPFAVLTILIALAAFFFRRNLEFDRSLAPRLLIIAFFPLVWVLILANHSQLHYFYTYRIHAVTAFALGAMIRQKGSL